MWEPDCAICCFSLFLVDLVYIYTQKEIMVHNDCRDAMYCNVIFVLYPM